MRRRSLAIALPNISAHGRCGWRIRSAISSSSKVMRARSRHRLRHLHPPAKKGYWIGQIDVRDAEGYKPYMIANQAPFGEFGARYLVRGGRQEVMEGKARSRIVVLEFPSYEAALACYNSPGYRAAKQIRAGKGEADIVVIEGYDGPQF